MTPEEWHEIEKQNKIEWKKIEEDLFFFNESCHTVDKQGRVKRIDPMKKIISDE